MALTLVNPLDVFRKARSEARSAAAQEAIDSLKHHIMQLGNPNLEFKAISGLNAADVVLADVACKVYGILVKKPTASTTAAWLKVSDHASAAAANGDIVVKMAGTGGGGQEHFVTFHDGLIMGTGATAGSHTTVNGNTKSNVADAPTGFAIVGA